MAAKKPTVSSVRLNEASAVYGRRTGVSPIKKPHMTFIEVRQRILHILAGCRDQFYKPAEDRGLSDEEFITHIIEPFESEIQREIDIENSAKKR